MGRTVTKYLTSQPSKNTFIENNPKFKENPMYFAKQMNRLLFNKRELILLVFLTLFSPAYSHVIHRIPYRLVVRFCMDHERHNSFYPSHKDEKKSYTFIGCNFSFCLELNCELQAV